MATEINWIDSTSSGVTGNKVFRDDIEIADIGMGIQVWIDSTAVDTVTYKYEVQAYWPEGITTKETIGVNVEYHTTGSTTDLQIPTGIQLSLGGSPPVTGTTPVLSNFRIESAEPSRVYFDASLSIAGMTTTGFVISNKTISGLTIDGDNLGGYFTVTEAFTFWENNTIRLGETDTISDIQTVLHNFTLEYITHDFVEPANDIANYRYVNADVTGGGDGLSDGTAWTWKEGVNNAVAGQTVWVKAGTYIPTGENYVNNSGTPTSPIKWIGYKAAIGDITENYYTFTPGQALPALDPTEQPLLDCQNNDTSIYPFVSYDRSNWILRNIQMTSGHRTILVQTGRSTMHEGVNMIVDNVNIIGATNGILTSVSKEAGDTRFTQTNTRFTNCNSINSEGECVKMQGTGNLIDNVKTYCDTNGSHNGSDYYIAFNGAENICRNSFAQRLDETIIHEGHGIGIRGGETTYADYGIHNYNNLIDNCESNHIDESFYSRNTYSDYNVIKNSKSNGTLLLIPSDRYDSGGIAIMDGASFNVFENCSFTNQHAAIRFINNGEGSTTGDMVADGNIIRNCIFDNTQYMFIPQILAAWNTYNAVFQNNKIQNCTFNIVGTGVRRGDLNNFVWSNNSIVNCIFDAMANEDYSTSELSFQTVFETITNNNFFDCGADFDVPPYIGTDGNIDLDPNFVDQIDFVPQEEAMVKPTIEGIYYSYNNKERNNTNTTMGAVLLLSENNN